MNQRDFYPILAEKLKNMGLPHDHNIVANTDFYDTSVTYFDMILIGTHKGKPKVEKEYDYRQMITLDTISMDKIVSHYGMEQYRAEMYDKIMIQACDLLVANGTLKLADNSRAFGPGRVFTKGDKHARKPR